jgi:hypothetical protein
VAALEGRLLLLINCSARFITVSFIDKSSKFSSNSSRLLAISIFPAATSSKTA